MGPDSDFVRRVHDIISLVPEGHIITYKDIASFMGCKAYRAIGRACNKSPGMPIVPCHRVVSSDYRLHGFAQGLEDKKRLLVKEGISTVRIMSRGRADYLIVNPEKHHYILGDNDGF